MKKSLLPCLFALGACGSSGQDQGPPPEGCQMAEGGTSTISGGPDLPVGEWRNISPPQVTFQQGDAATFTQGITIDPCDSGTLYLSVSSFDVEGGNPGIYKTTNGGSSWEKVGQLD